MGAYRFVLGRVLSCAIAAGVLCAASESFAQVVPDACITNVTATAPGVARTFRCAGGQIDFLVAVPPVCVQGGCGMITLQFYINNPRR